jgi:hypothetical protein
MAYKPPKQQIDNNDVKNIPSSEAIYEALKYKIDQPTISGTAGQLLQLDGYITDPDGILNEPITSWVNPPSALPSQTSNSEKVLATDGSTAYWAIEGVKTGYPTDTVIVGRIKPASITGINNTLVGVGTGNALTTGTNSVFIGINAGLLAQSVVGAIAIGSGALDALTTENGTGALDRGNVAIGINAFGSLTSSSDGANGGGAGVAIGKNAGANCTTGSGNVFIGANAGANWTTAQQSVVIGLGAGQNGNSQGSNFIGYQTGRGVTGQANTIISRNWQNQSILSTGNNNVFIGDVFGYNNATYGVVNLTSGSDNIGLGAEAGFLTATTSSAITLGKRSAAGSNEFAVGSSTNQINTMLLGRGGHTQTVANAVKIQTMRASGTDTNMSVGTLTIAGAQGTGTGAGGDVIIATAPPAVSSGSSLNAHVEVMRVTDDGLVGIGTATPTEKLEVNGNIKGGTVSFNADANRQATVANLGFLTATKTHDFGSIAHGAQEETTITVTGAAIGDAVFVGAPAAIEANLSWCAYVSAADTVTLRLQNVASSGNTNPASATWRVTVLKT